MLSTASSATASLRDNVLASLALIALNGTSTDVGAAAAQTARALVIGIAKKPLARV